MKKLGIPTTQTVTISAKCARLPFNGCQPDYIQSVCRGRCCYVQLPSGKTTVSVPLCEGESAALSAYGVNETADTLQAENGRCPLQDQETGFCRAHSSGRKPRSCAVSPWTLTTRNRLIISYRYRTLRCYKAEPCLPAYLAFACGLRTLFGETGFHQIERHFKLNGCDL